MTGPAGLATVDWQPFPHSGHPLVLRADMVVLDKGGGGRAYVAGGVPLVVLSGCELGGGGHPLRGGHRH